MTAVDEKREEDTILDEYPLPDASVSPTLLEVMDCPRKDLLPLSTERACELIEDLTVFAVLPEGGLEMPFTKEEIQIYPTESLFAVPVREWEKSMDFHIALNERMGRQAQRERAFLRHTGDCFAVYQFSGSRGHITLEAARTGGLSPRAAGYLLVYTGTAPEKLDVEKIEKRFQEHPPVDFHHRKTGVGDIIAVKKDGQLRTWYLGRLAVSELPGLFANIPLYRTGEHGEHLPLMDEIPLYRQTGEYAMKHGELNEFFASERANTACRDAVDRAVAENYHDWTLDTDAAVRQVREEFGYERMLHVLAASIRHYSWDGRISRDNIQWAESYPSIPGVSSADSGRNPNINMIVHKTHPGLLNMFTKTAREDYARNRPLSAEEITGEAERIFTELKKLESPNGPNYQSYVAQFSPEFVSRANEGDYTMLSSMIPFKSFEISPLREAYSGGLFARIARDENRGPGRWLKQPTYRPFRNPVKQKKAPER